MCVCACERGEALPPADPPDPFFFFFPSAATLAPLLDPATPAVAAALASAPASFDPAPSVRASLRGCAPEWGDVVGAVASSAALTRAGRARDAYDALAEAVGPFLKLFRDDPDAWLVDPMRRLAKGLRGAARAADGAEGGGGGAKCLENCGTQLQKFFAASIQGSGKSERERERERARASKERDQKKSCV